jgi:DnaJ family protein C protein 19
MLKILFLVALGCGVFKMVTGRWPWEKASSTRSQAVFRARRLLGVEADASRDDIIAAHKRLLTMVHPDRGGTNQQVHEANAARDILFDELADGRRN